MLLFLLQKNENSKQNIVDGNLDSTWSSDFRNVDNRDKEHCYIDLEASMDINQVKLHWVNNTAPGNKYAIQVSDDEKIGRLFIFTIRQTIIVMMLQIFVILIPSKRVM